MLKPYYHLTKPGIIRGNAITATGGFLLASGGVINFWRLVAMLVGMSLVIASACVFNNYIDRDIDSKMTRTKKRALVSGLVSTRSALSYAAILGIAGVIALLFYTNLLTMCLGLLGFVFYVFIYGIAKRRTVHGTLVGSISGAIPPVAGYTAAANRLDVGAGLLFLILVFWQMPHFYAIAMYRLRDYKSAKIPVLPLVKGIAHTKLQILIYIVLFIISSAALTISGSTGLTFAAVMTVIGLVWLKRGIGGYHTVDDSKWARGMFFFSLTVILVFSVMLSLDSWLP